MTQTHRTDSLRFITYTTPDFLRFTKKTSVAQYAETGFRHTFIAYTNSFSQCFFPNSVPSHVLSVFIFPHLLTMSFPPCLQHSSSSFYYSPGPPLPDPSPPTQNVIRSSHYQKKKKNKQQDQGGCFSPVEQIKKSSATHTL